MDVKKRQRRRGEQSLLGLSKLLKNDIRMFVWKKITNSNYSNIAFLDTFRTNIRTSNMFAVSLRVLVGRGFLLGISLL